MSTQELERDGVPSAHVPSKKEEPMVDTTVGNAVFPISRPARDLSRLFNLGLRLAPWAVIIGIWYAVCLLGIVPGGLVPTPDEVVLQFWTQLIRFDLASDVLASVQRVLIGLGTATVCAIPVGFLLGWYPSVRQFLDPVLNFFRALPPIALIPLVIVYFGIGEVAKGVILFYAAFFASVIVLYEGISQISPIYIRVARTLGASDFEIFHRVIVPLTVPHILTAMRVALGICWGTLVASELVAAQSGLGAMIQDASAYFQLDTIYVGIICIGLIALVMDTVLRMVTRRLVSWQERIA